MADSPGEKFVEIFKRFMPDSFVFALLLTLICGLTALFVVDASPLKIISSWYTGFWSLLEFGMQMVLILVTGFSIALSPQVKKLFDRLGKFVSTPGKVYVFVIIIGTLLGMISWGWAVIAAVLGRSLAENVKGVDYRFLVACVYISGNGWVAGLSSSIPLLLNTEGNFLIKAGLLAEKIPTSMTLGSTLNLSMIAFYLIVPPLVMYCLRPKRNIVEFDSLLTDQKGNGEISIEEEAKDQNLKFKALSDIFNNSRLLQLSIVIMGSVYIVHYFWTKGFDLNLPIMIFIFLMLGMLLHRTPLRYVIAMKRASTNISGIVFQYPFYAGIMGIMVHTGLGASIGSALASNASVYTYPFYAFLAGGIVNFAIPSAGGEFAVLAPSVIAAVKGLGAGLGAEVQLGMIAKASLAIAYGETLTNMLQPFFFLVILPVMGAGVRLQVRDVMGYLFIPFAIYFLIESVMITLIPV